VAPENPSQQPEKMTFWNVTMLATMLALVGTVQGLKLTMSKTIELTRATTDAPATADEKTFLAIATDRCALAHEYAMYNDDEYYYITPKEQHLLDRLCLPRELYWHLVNTTGSGQDSKDVAARFCSVIVQEQIIEAPQPRHGKRRGVNQPNLSTAEMDWINSTSNLCHGQAMNNLPDSTFNWTTHFANIQNNINASYHYHDNLSQVQEDMQEDMIDLAEDADEELALATEWAGKKWYERGTNEDSYYHHYFKGLKGAMQNVWWYFGA
jgi:hypothetical protein